MSAPPANIQVYVSDCSACIRIVGRANVGAASDFKRLVNGLLDKGINCFLLDLSECLLMDSTFLGVLAGFGQKLTRPQNGQPDAFPIQLFNPNARVEELLGHLGVMHLFKLSRGEVPKAGCGPAETLSHQDETREEVARNCLEAHRTLMALNPENVSKFKDVTRFLAEDLKKLKAGG
jgi:anti-sigma B factor antagonist